ncbi:MAG: hypothetical protein AAF927_32445 [Bacteroidota bacterium]
MDTVLNTIIILFWSTFFLATILSLFMGLRRSLRKPKTDESYSTTEGTAVQLPTR